MIEGLLATLLSGGATGILGSLVSGATDYFKSKQLFLHEREMVKLETIQLEKELENAREITRMEGETKRDVADATALSTSYSADVASYALGKARESKWFVFVDVLRGVIRPMLTIYLAAVVTFMYIDFYALMHNADAVPVQDIVQMSQQIVYTVLYVATTVILWWFGSRNKISKRLFK